MQGGMSGGMVMLAHSEPLSRFGAMLQKQAEADAQAEARARAIAQRLETAKAKAAACGRTLYYVAAGALTPLDLGVGASRPQYPLLHPTSLAPVPHACTRGAITDGEKPRAVTRSSQVFSDARLLIAGVVCGD